MTRKKILIVNNNMHLGGVQRSLANLLGCIHDKYDITLALFHPEGALMDQIPPDVKILPIRSAYRYLGMTREDVRGAPVKKAGRSIFAAISRIFGRSAAISLMAPGQRTLSGYDAAISFLHDSSDKAFYGGCNDFVLRHVVAKKKIAFLHCDYSACGADTPENTRRYARFDAIAACSDGCRRVFLQALPQLSDRTFTVCNCQDYDRIRRAALAAPVSLPAGRINVLTVARLGREKGVLRAVEAIAAITEPAADFHYYIIGDGIQRPQIEDLIRTHGLRNRVTMLGERSNPYGYMQAADLLLIPSVSEAAPMVIAEAVCLGTPVLSTRTSSADDMIRDPGYGWVCENDTQAITEALTGLLIQKERIYEKKQSLLTVMPDNSRAVSQFAELLERS